MSDNKTVPSAEEILELKKSISGWLKIMPSNYQREEIVQAMHEHTRLHLEAMRDEMINEITNNILLDKAYEESPRLKIGAQMAKIIVEEAANTYIKNNKL